MISSTEWEQFKEKYILNVFKEGSSIIKLEGSWKDPITHKLITEPTYLVIYFHKPSPAISRQIDSLRTWYKKIFDQQSVLKVDKKVKAYF